MKMSEKALSDCGSICNQIECVCSFHYKISGGANGLHRKISLLDRRDLEYEYLNIYDEVTHLKTQINVQQDKIKKLITKLLRITSQQKKIFGAQNPCCNVNKTITAEDQNDRIKELEVGNQKLLSKLNTLKLQLCSQKQLTVYKTFVKRSHVRGVRPLTSRLHGASCDCQDHCITKEFIYKFTTRDGIGVINEDIEPESSSNTVQVGDLTSVHNSNILILEDKVSFLEKELEKLKPQSEQKIMELENELEKLNTLINQKNEKTPDVPKNKPRCICEKYTKADTINKILKQQLDGALNSNGNLVEQLRIEKDRSEDVEKQLKVYKQKLDELLIAETKTNQITQLQNEHAKKLQAISVRFNKEKDNLQKEIQNMQMDSEALKGTNKDLNVKLNDLQNQLDALQVKFAGQNKTPRSPRIVSYQKASKDVEKTSEVTHGMTEAAQQLGTILEENIIVLKGFENEDKESQQNSEIIDRQPKPADISNIFKTIKHDQKIEGEQYVNNVTENLNREECNCKMDYSNDISTPCKDLNCQTSTHYKADSNIHSMPNRDWLADNQNSSPMSNQRQAEMANDTKYSEKTQELNVKKISFQPNVIVRDCYSKDSSKLYVFGDADPSKSTCQNDTKDQVIVATNVYQCILYAKSCGEFDANSSSNFVHSTSEDVSTATEVLKRCKSTSATASLGEVTSDSRGISSCDETDIYLTSEEVKQALKNIAKELCTCKDLLEHNQINIKSNNVWRRTHSAKANTESDDTQNDKNPENLISKKKKKIKKKSFQAKTSANNIKESVPLLKQSVVIINQKPILENEAVVEQDTKINNIERAINTPNSLLSARSEFSQVESNESQLQTLKLTEMVEKFGSKNKLRRDTSTTKITPVVSMSEHSLKKNCLDEKKNTLSNFELQSTFTENDSVEKERRFSSVSSSLTTENVNNDKRVSKGSSIYTKPVVQPITSHTKSFTSSVFSNTDSTLTEDNNYPEGILNIHFGKLNFNYDELKLLINSKIFLTWQFYTMSSRFTPIKSWKDTTFDFTSSYKIIATPNLIQYMKNNNVCIEVHYTVKNHSKMFATSLLPLIAVLQNPNIVVSTELCVNSIPQNSSLPESDLSPSQGNLTCECVLHMANDDLADLMRLYNTVPDAGFDVNNDFLHT